MPQEYVDDITREQLYTVNADAQHLFLRDLLTVIIVTLVLILSFTLLSITGFELAPILDAFGLSLLQFIQILAGILTVVIIGLALYDFAIAGDVRYEIHTDKLFLHTHENLIFLTEEEIPYEDIATITYDHANVVERLTGAGTITLGLSGREQETKELHAIDNVEEITQYIKKVQRSHATERRRRDEANQEIDETTSKL